MTIHPLPKPAASAEQLNRSCRCASLSRDLLRRELSDWDAAHDIYRMVGEERPYLFAEAPVFLDRASLQAQLAIIAAAETVIALPAYQERVLRYAPESARFPAKAHGVFVGYDFHLSPDGPKIIEINSNAGGGLLNALAIRAQMRCCEEAGSQRPGDGPALAATGSAPEAQFMQMFADEWRCERDGQALQTIAIVDEDPQNQYLWPEFLLFQALFERHGIRALICDPTELSHRDSALWHGDIKIDLVYNRLTDFGLEHAKQQPLLQAYLAADVVLTPHPRNHALYADKRNLALLGDTEFLAEIGIDATSRDILRRGIAATRIVETQRAEWFWQHRKQLFFKPAKGYGSKAAYRGDKLTLRVFDEILRHDYVAQALVKPSERQLDAGDLKLDLRHFVYRGQTQLVCARLYQGQTTNFRTPGGGFAQVVVTP
ncbi:hypothetical protein NP603_03620 [Methylomonas sp. SURF-1]|uniref:Circularly permuted type 2 ATP-grasp protein n=1 Tax=Methylomonas aurea TaxID=2952224 RepID=A0ABT1UD79_9GAMM|nr:hypothetical protein [Methylomonas sp. SURF-1]MCQ8180188.1 hypothetical protein [Methylomonas sp. SURF-1]